MSNILIVIGLLIAAACAGYFLRKYLAGKKLKDASAQAQLILDDAKKQAQDRRREVELEAKDLLYKMRQDFEHETKDRRQEINNL